MKYSLIFLAFISGSVMANTPLQQSVTTVCATSQSSVQCEKVVRAWLKVAYLQGKADAFCQDGATSVCATVKNMPNTDSDRKYFEEALREP